MISEYSGPLNIAHPDMDANIRPPTTSRKKTKIGRFSISCNLYQYFEFFSPAV